MEARIITRSSCSQISLLSLALCVMLILSNAQTTLAKTTKTKTKTTKTNKSSEYESYLNRQCGTTTYHKICYISLSPYTKTIRTNDIKLCTTALTVTLRAARRTRLMLTTLLKQRGRTKIEASVSKDCIYEIKDLIDEIKQSLHALRSVKLGSRSRYMAFQVDSVKTWISAAITDASTCMDGFVGEKSSSRFRNEITENVVYVSRLTSNAIALIDRLGY